MGLKQDNKALFKEAVSLYEQGKVKEAIERYNSLLDDSELGFLAALNLGKIYRDLGDFNEAVRLFEKAYLLRKEPELLFLIGETLYLQKKDEEAKDYLTRFLKASEDSYEAFFILGMIEYKNGNFLNAIKFFEKALKLRETEECLFFLGKSYFFEGDHKKAFKLFEELIKKAPENPDYLQFYGLILLENGSYKDAEKVLIKALELSPNYERYKDLLDRLDYDKKVEEYSNMKDKIQELEEKIQENSASFYEVLEVGFFYFFKKDYEKAMNYFTMAKEAFLAGS